MGSETVILGGGLAGLSAGGALARAGRCVQVLEGGRQVGGLARTINHAGFRFDLGGHRFFTHEARVEQLVRDILGAELLSVPRASQIYLRGCWIDYPLRPWGALAGLGVRTSAAILLGYARARLAQRLHPAPPVSLEDWVVAHFGRPMFELYFRDYSEKVWGIGCRDISAQWMAERVQGLSLGIAVRRALWQRGPALPTLVDRFLYPRLGIGRIAERLREEIERSGEVLTDARVERVHHDGRRIVGIAARRGGGDARSLRHGVSLHHSVDAPGSGIAAARASRGTRDGGADALSRSRDRGSDAQSRARDRSDLDLLSGKRHPLRAVTRAD